MSTTIDKRLVELGLENRQFEKGAETTIKTLDSLKKGLDFGKANSGFSELSRISSNFTMAPMSAALSSVTGGFSALGVIGITALANITNSVVNLGKQIATKLVVDPLKTGLREYETQIGAIQTVLANTASKGTTLKDVNGALDELNRYADKTIYNFSEMTRNIGTFTAAGIDLDTSTAAIKGIANLAAVSGSNAQQASTAMYQLSQAMASGTVRLMDWNSVVNAGMGGEVFKNALMDTAKVHGVQIDAMIKKQGSFRETLQEGWLTTDILTETLSKFTGDLTESQLLAMGYTKQQADEIQKLGVMANDAATKVKTISQLTQTIGEAISSGWAKSWQIVLGDFEEAKSLMTEASDRVGAYVQSFSDGRNKILQDWSKFGGRVAVIDALRNSFNALVSVLGPVGKGFSEMFPPITGYQLSNLSKGIRDFTAKLVLSDDAAEKVKRTFRGVGAIFDIVKMAAGSLIKGILPVGSTFASIGNKLIGFTAKIGDHLVNLRNLIKTNDTFNKAVASISGFISEASQKVQEFGARFSEGFRKAKDSVLAFIQTGDFKATMAKVSEGIKKFVQSMKDAFKKLSELNPGFLDGFMARVKARFSSLGDIFKGGAGLVGGAFDKVSPVLESGVGKMKATLEKVKSFIFSIGKGLFDGFSKIDFSKFDFNKTFDAINAGLLSGLILSITNFVKKGSTVFDGVSGIFDSVKGVADSVSKISGSFTGVLEEVRTSLQTWQESLRADMLMKIAGAIAILAISLIALSLVDSAKLTTALGAITVLFTDLFGSLMVFEKVSGAGDIPAMSKAIGAMTGLAVAVLLFSIALTALAKIDPGKLQGAMLAITGITALLVGSGLILSKYSGDMGKSALGLILMGVAILIMTKAVEILANIRPDLLAVGLMSLAGILAEIAVFSKVINSSGGMGNGLALIGLAAGLIILSAAVKIFSEMDQGKLVQGLAAVGILLSEIAIFARATGNSKLLLQTAASIVIFAVAMIVMGEAVAKMGEMSWDEIARGMTVLAGAMIIVVAALKLLPKNTAILGVGLLIVAGAMYVMSLALQSMGSLSWEEILRGVVALAATLGILALAMYAMSANLAGAAAMIVVAGAMVIMAFALQLLGSMSIAQVGIGLLALVGAFIVFGLAGLILAPILPILLGLAAILLIFGLACLTVGVGITLLTVAIGTLAAVGGAGMMAFGATLVALALAVMQAVPTIAAAFVQMFVQIVQTFAENIPVIVQAGMDMVIGLLEGIRDNIKDIVSTALEVVAGFLAGIAEGLPGVIESGFDLLVAFLDGIADGLEDHMGEITDSGLRIAKALGQGLIDGLGGLVIDVIAAAKKLADSVIETLKKLFKIHSPSDVTDEMGGNIGQGLANGMIGTMTMLGNTAGKVGRAVVSSLSKTISSIPSLLDSEMDMNPKIRPVLDLSAVTDGVGEMDKRFGSRTIALSASLANMAYQTSDKKDIGMTKTPDQNAPSTQTQMIFNQNNYSPEPLSAYEIYRQTRNQLELMKGLTK